MVRHLVVAAALVANLAGGAAAAEPSVPPAPAAAAAAPLPDSTALLDAARAKVADGDTKGAIAGLAPYVAAHPEDAAAGRLLGDIYFRIPDYPRAERVWHAVLAHVPDDHETHSRLGSLYAVEDRIDDAIAEFQKSLPTRTGYEGLALAHKRAGDLADYFRNLEFATTRTPFEPQVWMDLAAARQATGEFDRAAIAYAHAAGLRPTDCGPKVDLATVLVDLHQIAPAMEQLQACLKIDPQSYPATVDLGEAYLEQRDAAGARPYLERALVLRPQGCEALVDLGYIADMQGDWKTAMSYYNRALRADPMRPEAYIDLGYDYNEHRIFTLAEAAYLKGLSVAADDGRLHYLLAVTYNLQGKIALARQEYHEALDTGGPDVVGAATADLALLPPS
jgi:tetratricopeptide (TPR) repeat protein